MKETGARAFSCDASERAQVDKLFADVDSTLGAPDVVIYNASFRTRGPFVDLDPADVQKALDVTAFGAFLVAQQAARRMLPNKHGAILLTGASAGVKGYPQSAPFAMGKFALRGLAQSVARELSPQGIHVAHVVIDGGIRSARRPNAPVNGRRACSIPRPSPTPTCTSSISPAARGRGRSSCGRGWRSSNSTESSEPTRGMMEAKVTIPALLQMKRDGQKSVGVVAWTTRSRASPTVPGVDIVS